MTENDSTIDIKQLAKERFYILLVAVMFFGRILTDMLLSNWLHQTFPSLPKALEYVLISTPALIIVLVLYLRRAPVIAWFERIGVSKR